MRGLFFICLGANGFNLNTSVRFFKDDVEDQGNFIQDIFIRGLPTGNRAKCQAGYQDEERKYLSQLLFPSTRQALIYLSP